MESIGFGDFTCEVGSEEVGTYEGLVDKIRGCGECMNIKFSTKNKPSIICILNCADGGVDDSGKPKKGAQITLKEIRLENKSENESENELVWPKDGNYNYPSTKEGIININSALFNIYSSGLNEKRRAETSLIFMLCDAARSYPCEKIAKSINRKEDTSYSYTIDNLHGYVNEYTRCYESTYGKNPTKIDPSERKVLTKLDYEIFNLLDKCREDKSATEYLFDLSNHIHSIQDDYIQYIKSNKVKEAAGFIEKEEIKKEIKNKEREILKLYNDVIDTFLKEDKIPTSIRECDETRHMMESVKSNISECVAKIEEKMGKGGKNK